MVTNCNSDSLTIDDRNLCMELVNPACIPTADPHLGTI